MKELVRTLIKNRKPLLLGLGILLIISMWLGSSIVNLVHNKLENKKLARQSVELDREYQELLLKKERLEKQDPALIEDIARTEYNLAKPNEIEVRFSTK